ncbi:hypothetical protein DLJ53_28535 [Acuticoccus sediminis]|uniref:Hemolysin-type calcium-binding repeat-containing protein n=1 Tax=Acuticoccus sediminis TaxID=2184697 RepID=A0A8B2NFX8_9HYPH|nr:calcium-binding protein [Acuticoccus sediminis]RAH97789.1 hypothetical protein DLJ53_28535 [Acuticoccus sediminis]
MPEKTIVGSNLRDIINGTDDPEFIDALGGNDVVFAGGGDDEVRGRAGNDLLIGDEGDDTLFGDGGDDTVTGGAGNDVITWRTGDGSDVVEGGAGYDTANFHGSQGLVGDNFEIASVGARIEFRDGLVLPSIVSIGTTEKIVVRALDGNDNIDASALEGGIVDFFADGGDGNDTVSGSNGSDLLRGGADNDVLIGNKGNDTMEGGDGRDLMVWNNGDGSDTMIGGAGGDTAQVNGSEDSADSFKVSAPDGEVLFQRTNLGPFSIAIKETERLEINGLGGNDTINAHELPAGLISIVADGGAGNDRLFGSAGGDLLQGGTGDDRIVGNKGDDTMEGGDGRDTMVWNNGDGSDVMDGGAGNADVAQVNGSSGENGDHFVVDSNLATVLFERVNLGPFSLEITNTERLELSGLEGNDTIDASALRGGLIDVVMNGGNGDDELIGSQGDDTLVGAKGDDTMLGGGGNDTMVWNNGDGSDVMNGGNGNDTAMVTGSDFAGDEFEIRSTVNGEVVFERVNFGNFTLDISNTETLIVKGYGGDDSIDARALDDGFINLRLSGNAGDDTIFGSKGDDRISGDEGNDTLAGDQGNDVFVFSEGEDTVRDFGVGNDRIEFADELDVNFGDVQAGLTQVGAHAQIDLGNGNVLTLENTNVNDIGFFDFIF